METILHISFNQDGSCFCLGTKKGFFVYNTSPLKMLSFREFNEGINIVEMLKKTNILALVEESDKDTDLLNNKLIIWDDHQNKRISELKLDSEILNVKIKLDKIIVSTNNNYLYLIEITTLEINSVFQMYENSNGLFAVSMDDKILVVAFPYKYTGYVKIKKFNSKENIPSINAHDSNISFLSLSNDGNLLATSSERGTLIRIFSTFNGEMIQELRRGAKTAQIYYITFDMNNKFLACSSSSGTVHIFSIYNSIKYLKEKGIIDGKSNNLDKKESVDLTINPDKIEEPKNQKSFIGSIINVLKIGISYFESEWSFVQFRLPKSEKEKAIVSFGQFENSISVLTKSGNLYKASFEPSLGGECHDIIEKNLFQQDKKNNENE